MLFYNQLLSRYSCLHLQLESKRSLEPSTVVHVGHVQVARIMKPSAQLAVSAAHMQNLALVATRQHAGDEPLKQPKEFLLARGAAKWSHKSGSTPRNRPKWMKTRRFPSSSIDFHRFLKRRSSSGSARRHRRRPNTPCGPANCVRCPLLGAPTFASGVSRGESSLGSGFKALKGKQAHRSQSIGACSEAAHIAIVYMTSVLKLEGLLLDLQIVSGCYLQWAEPQGRANLCISRPLFSRLLARQHVFVGPSILVRSRNWQLSLPTPAGAASTCCNASRSHRFHHVSS